MAQPAVILSGKGSPQHGCIELPSLKRLWVHEVKMFFLTMCSFLFSKGLSWTMQSVGLLSLHCVCALEELLHSRRDCNMLGQHTLYICQNLFRLQPG